MTSRTSFLWKCQAFPSSISLFFSLWLNRPSFPPSRFCRWKKGRSLERPQLQKSLANPPLRSAVHLPSMKSLCVFVCVCLQFIHKSKVNWVTNSSFFPPIVLPDWDRWSRFLWNQGSFNHSADLRRSFNSVRFFIRVGFLVLKSWCDWFFFPPVLLCGWCWCCAGVDSLLYCQLKQKPVQTVT